MARQGDKYAGRPGRKLLWGAVLALLLQSLYPPGVMPGNLEDGWVASICPKGLPMAFAHRLGLHGAHHHGHTADQTLGDCQLGSAVEQPLAEPDPAAQLQDFLPETWQDAPRPRVLLAARDRFHDTRAPPLTA